MSRRFLREAAKFLAGLVTADLLMLIWASANNLFPISMWGATWTSDIVFPGIVFDIAVIIILIHYGWHLGKIPRPKESAYLTLAGVIFTIVAVAHLARIFSETEIQILGWIVPLWLSWIGTIVAAYMAYASFHFAAFRGK